MTRLYRLFLLTLVLGITFNQVDAQFWKKKKKKEGNVQGFVLEEAQTPEERKKAMERQLTSPVRKMLNRFNLSVEKSYGYFSYQNPLEGVSVIRNPRNDLLYIVPIGEESTAQPSVAYSNWFNRFTEVDISRIDDDSQIVRTDTASFVYKNSGRYNPLTLRLSYSIKKLDKGHFERTGEKRYLDDDMLRIGGGIGWGAHKFRHPSSEQDVDPLLRRYQLPETKISTTKMFASVTYNFYSLGDFSMLADVYGGVWKIKQSQINSDNINYEPFFNVGLMFQTTFSKYFKGYIRPSFEMRSYTLANDVISTQHKYSILSIDLGLLFKYPVYPRNKYKADMVQMEHVFNGKMYRGRPFYKKQNPRYGQRGVNRKAKGWSFPIIKDKKSKKGGEKGGGNGN